MIIVNQREDIIINFTNVISIYVKEKDVQVLMNCIEGALILGKYATEDRAKEVLQEIIERLKNYNDLQDKIDDLFKSNIDNKEMDFMNAGSICIGHESVVVYLLEKMFDTDMISYFIYELDYGKKYKVGYVLDANMNEIDLSTAEKLYEYLIKETEV